MPDIEARLNEAVGDGADVVWTHGSQFYEATAKVAEDNPDVAFIGEFDGTAKDQPANVWTIDRQFHIGFYGMGVFASELSKTGKVGYVGGLSLPFSMSEVHAMEQAIADTGASTEITPVWTGDFNDAAKAQQFATQLIGSGADVIVGSLNQGATGTFQAFEGKPEGSGWVTAKYTDKSAAAGPALRREPRVRLRQAARGGPRQDQGGHHAPGATRSASTPASRSTWPTACRPRSRRSSTRP